MKNQGDNGYPLLLTLSAHGESLENQIPFKNADNNEISADKSNEKVTTPRPLTPISEKKGGEGDEEAITPNPDAFSSQIQNNDNADTSSDKKDDSTEKTIIPQNYLNILNDNQHQATCPENGLCLGFTAMTGVLLFGLYALGIFGGNHSEL